MSFSSEVKDELVRLKLRTAGEKRALLCAFTYSAGSIMLGRGVGVRYATENQEAGDLIARLACELYGVEATLSLSEKNRLNAHSTVVRLRGAEGCTRLLREAGCLGSEEEGLSLGAIAEPIVAGDALRRCFLRGAFLGAGSVSDPRKSYHLELVCKSERFAAGLCGLMAEYALGARYLPRKASYVVYLKEGEMVADFLTLIGAMNSTLDFAQARVMRQVAGSVNRIRNFEEANMNKAAGAAAQQLLDIECIMAEQGLETLPPRLRQAAEARYNHPEATLAELAELVGVSKSGLNHRFARLAELAAALR